MKAMFIVMVMVAVLSVAVVAVADEIIMVAPVADEISMGMLHGTVAGVDNAAKTVDIKLSQPGILRSESENRQFSTDEVTNITMCSMQKQFDDIKVGEEADIAYEEINGRYIARNIDLKLPILGCNLESM